MRTPPPPPPLTSGKPNSDFSRSFKRFRGSGAAHGPTAEHLAGGVALEIPPYMQQQEALPEIETDPQSITVRLGEGETAVDSLPDATVVAVAMPGACLREAAVEPASTFAAPHNSEGECRGPRNDDPPYLYISYADVFDAYESLCKI